VSLLPLLSRQHFFSFLSHPVIISLLLLSFMTTSSFTQHSPLPLSLAFLVPSPTISPSAFLLFAPSRLHPLENLHLIGSNGLCCTFSIYLYRLKNVHTILLSLPYAIMMSLKVYIVYCFCFLFVSSFSESFFPSRFSILYVNFFLLSIPFLSFHNSNNFFFPFFLPDYHPFSPPSSTFLFLTNYLPFRPLFLIISSTQFSIWLSYSRLQPSFFSFPFISFPILSCPFHSYPILSYPILSYPILSNPILSNPILSNPILSNPIQSYPFLSFLSSIILFLVLLIFLPLLLSDTFFFDISFLV
jgi:hypothetical protein